MQALIKEFRIVDDNNLLFNSDDKYMVPLYQRAYAWTDNEIIQLIDDINDYDDTYYLGSLIVHKREENLYEVIDGQQRLTTLYLLFDYLNLSQKNSLIFECRDKSNYTLTHLKDNDVEDKMLEQTIINGITVIKNKFNESGIDVNDFIAKLRNVVIYRIEVPEHTDLNRYFEIMNTRGEQLEQHDILKAMLMSYLKTSEDRDAFASIWDACSDMTGYVQMHIDRNVRDYVCDWDWGRIKDDSIKEIKNNRPKKYKSAKLSIKDIIKSDFKVDLYDEETEKEDRVRFESIIEFPYFLIHVLKVFINNNQIVNKNPDEKIINELLDDKKLIDTFRNVIENGLMDDKEIDKEWFSYNFINCLIKCRFLFDKYILKREYPLNNEEGVWSIKYLRVSGQKTQKKPYYVNTEFNRMKEWESTYKDRNQLNIMIQSCLRVSYTSPKVMHWITKLLNCLYDVDDYSKLATFNEVAEGLAKEAVKNDFLVLCETKDPIAYNMGVNTPHIVLNYLDYLIWKNNKAKYKDFIFEFRNSVEHWYPQNPSDGTFTKWYNVDTFGNLCIIQRNVNSKFSNMAPEAKKSTYKDMITKGSLKLRLMAEMTNDSLAWKDEVCQKHEDKMLELLKRDM